MKGKKYPHLIVRLGGQGFNFSTEQVETENDKPNFGDVYFNLNGLKGQGCRYSITKQSGMTSSHKAICNVLHSSNGILRMRLGEAFTVIAADGYHQITIYRLIDDDKKTPVVHSDKHRHISRHQFDKMRESYRVRQSATEKGKLSPPVPQAEPGCRGGSGTPIVKVRDARTKPKVRWWKKIIHAITGRAA